MNPIPSRLWTYVRPYGWVLAVSLCLVAIVGVPADKDWPGVLETLAAYSCDHLLLTRAANSRLRFPAEAGDYCGRSRPVLVNHLAQSA